MSAGTVTALVSVLTIVAMTKTVQVQGPLPVPDAASKSVIPMALTPLIAADPDGQCNPYLLISTPRAAYGPR